jgi:flagellar biosynthesis/type III secretory pathway protein FliH
MLEILSTNRSLEQMIEEEEAMLSQVDQKRLPSFRIGMRQGIVQGKVEGRVEGRVEGQVRMLHRLLEHRFGALPQWATEKLTCATEQELSAWSDSILTAPALDAVFNTGSVL